MNYIFISCTEGFGGDESIQLGFISRKKPLIQTLTSLFMCYILGAVTSELRFDFFWLPINTRQYYYDTDLVLARKILL